MAKKCLIRGNSMWPFLHDGDIVMPIEVNDLKVGDIVIFITSDNMKIFHRVVLLNKREIKCKGDNCLHFDWIKYDFGTNYRVIRHEFQTQVAKLSRFWGESYYHRYVKNPSKYQSSNVYIKLLTLLQRISMKSLHIVYHLCVRRNSNG